LIDAASVQEMLQTVADCSRQRTKGSLTGHIIRYSYDKGGQKHEIVLDHSGTIQLFGVNHETLHWQEQI